MLPDVEYVLNNTVNKTTGETPSILLFGVDQRGKSIDGVKEHLIEGYKDEVRDLGKIREKAEGKTLASLKIIIKSISIGSEKNPTNTK